MLCDACGGIIDAQYNLEVIGNSLSKDAFQKRERTMWRWHEFLPVKHSASPVSANEGGTPLVRLKKFAERIKVTSLYAKDETKNPTGTFKDRGASVTVSKLHEFGIREIVVASEGNAGCSFAFYSNIAAIRCHVYMPNFVGAAKKQLAEKVGSSVHLVRGTIQEAGVEARERASRRRLYNASTFVTPYRHDGKATMAYEIVEDLGWKAPGAVVYPIGGGVGLVGMWKAFKALKQIGWIDSLPRMVGVQASNCAPVIRALRSKLGDISEWPRPKTIASGLQVPKPLAGYLILRAIYESNGSGVTVSDTEIRKTMWALANTEGMLLEPSSAAAFAALPKLIDQGSVEKDEEIVVVATGSGLKTLDEF